MPKVEDTAAIGCAVTAILAVIIILLGMLGIVVLIFGAGFNLFFGK